jgi:hypothetical protein
MSDVVAIWKALLPAVGHVVLQISPSIQMETAFIAVVEAYTKREVEEAKRPDLNQRVGVEVE